MAPSHLAVEMLHAQLLAALCMGCEFMHASVEMTVLANVQIESALIGYGLERLQHTPFARGRHCQLLRP